MTHRDNYEKWQREKTEMAMDIRLKLVECFTEQADRARRERRWEAAAAYDYAAAVSLGYVAKIEQKEVSDVKTR